MIDVLIAFWKSHPIIIDIIVKLVTIIIGGLIVFWVKSYINNRKQALAEIKGLITGLSTSFNKFQIIVARHFTTKEECNRNESKYNKGLNECNKRIDSILQEGKANPSQTEGNEHDELPDYN